MPIQSPKPAPGDTAPPFVLTDQEGREHRLADYRGRWVVLYFYPKDQTPGCTREACALRDAYTTLREQDAVVLGVSLDDVASHARFAQRHRLPFPLLADVDGSAARAYGALLALGPLRFARRHTFLIDPQGRIAQAFRRVAPARHGEQVLAALKRHRDPPA